jgi:hypothetical protein
MQKGVIGMSSAGKFFEADIFLVFVVVVHRILLQFWVNNSKVISLLMNFWLAALSPCLLILWLLFMHHQTAKLKF